MSFSGPSGARGEAPGGHLIDVQGFSFAGALQAHLEPHAQLGPQVQGWQVHCLLEHLSVILLLLKSSVSRTVEE